MTNTTVVERVMREGTALLNLIEQGYSGSFARATIQAALASIRGDFDRPDMCELQDEAIRRAYFIARRETAPYFELRAAVHVAEAANQLLQAANAHQAHTKYGYGYDAWCANRDDSFAAAAVHLELAWQWIAKTNRVVKAAQFAFSPEDRKHGSGAMRGLRQAVQAYSDAQASE